MTSRVLSRDRQSVFLPWTSWGHGDRRRERAHRSPVTVGSAGGSAAADGRPADGRPTGGTRCPRRPLGADRLAESSSPPDQRGGGQRAGRPRRRLVPGRRPVARDRSPPAAATDRHCQWCRRRTGQRQGCVAAHAGAALGARRTHGRERGPPSECRHRLRTRAARRARRGGDRPAPSASARSGPRHGGRRPRGLPGRGGVGGRRPTERRSAGAVVRGVAPDSASRRRRTADLGPERREPGACRADCSVRRPVVQGIGHRRSSGDDVALRERPME